MQRQPGLVSSGYRRRRLLLCQQKWIWLPKLSMSPKLGQIKEQRETIATNNNEKQQREATTINSNNKQQRETKIFGRTEIPPSCSVTNCKLIVNVNSLLQALQASSTAIADNVHACMLLFLFTTYNVNVQDQLPKIRPHFHYFRTKLLWWQVLKSFRFCWAHFLYLLLMIA